MLAATTLQAVGRIRTAIGPLTAMRASGVAVQLAAGDLVYQGDVIETEADGAVGIVFTDGTAFSLSAGARMTLNEFVYDPFGTSNSALLNLLRGTFAFIAGKVANTGGFRIDTPVGRIRGSTQKGGFGILTLAAMTFASTHDEVQAAARQDAFLDDGTITYKDLEHGTFEIVTRDGRVIIADDPGETIVIDPTGAVARIPNSSSRMAELQNAQQSAFATLVGQQGAASGGSGSSNFDIQEQLQPINLNQLHNDVPVQAVTVTANITPASSGVLEVEV